MEDYHTLYLYILARSDITIVCKGMQFPDYPMDHHICALKLSSCEAKHWILINHRDGFVQHWKYGWDFLQVMLLAIQKLGPLSGNLCNKLSICSDVQIQANKCWFKWTSVHTYMFTYGVCGLLVRRKRYITTFLITWKTTLNHKMI